MNLELKPYPFANGLEAVAQSGRRAWRPADTWAKIAGDSGGAGAGHWTPPPPAERATGGDWASRLTHGSGTPGGNDLDALGDPEVPQDVRNIVVAAVMRGGEYARQAADRVAQMVDDGLISAAVGAAALRAINLKPAMTGDFQVGDGSGGDGRISSPPDGWGVGGTDPWAGGKRPAMRDIAPPSDAPGYLYPPGAKSRRALTLAKGRKLTRLERTCQLIATDGPFDTAPNMTAIRKQVAREFELGLLAA
jgi:hypothetical protein